MSVRDAFEQLLSIHKRQMTLKRESLSISLKATPSNYSRILAGPSETAIEGREFVIAKNQLVGEITSVKRGDRLQDSGELGDMTISEVVELYDLGGAVIGYRVRTS